MNLYQIDQAIMNCVDENGEIIDFEQLQGLLMAKEQKLEGVACWIKNLNAEVSELKAEEKKLAERRGVKERKVNGLMRYLSAALEGQKFETARCLVSFRKTSKVEVSDMQAVTSYLEENGLNDLITYAEPSVSKTELAKLLKAGQMVPGCEQVEGLSMSIK